MNRRFISIACLTTLTCGVGAMLLNWYADREARLPAISGHQMEDRWARVHGTNQSQSEPPGRPLDPSRPVRFAIGNLGLSDEGQNQQLADLLMLKLTDAVGMELVEREYLTVALREQEMSAADLVRASDAVRIGKILRADWFLLGSTLSIHGTNILIARIVDARTGMIRDANVFPCHAGLSELAATMAGFVSRCCQNLGPPKTRMFLAIGGFADVGVNNRQSSFPSQLEAYLTGAYQHSEITLLERESADALLREVRLDLAGLTVEGSANEPPPFQSAFWLVDGFFQSFETSGFEVELALTIKRSFGAATRVNVRGQPGEALFNQIKDSIDQAMRNAPPSVCAPTRQLEIDGQMQMGKDLLASAWGLDPTINLFQGRNQGNEQDHPRRRYNVEEAARAFQTVLLLDHDNREAKVLLGACLQDWTMHRSDEAISMFKEVARSVPPDLWSKKAQSTLEALNFMQFGQTAGHARNYGFAQAGGRQQRGAGTSETVASGLGRNRGRFDGAGSAWLCKAFWWKQTGSGGAIGFALA